MQGQTAPKIQPLIVVIGNEVSSKSGPRQHKHQYHQTPKEDFFGFFTAVLENEITGNPEDRIKQNVDKVNGFILINY
jgi:hypothetical protein